MDLKQNLDDQDRLAALEETGLLDSPPEEAFDRFSRLASQVLQTPIILVSLVTHERQFFKSRIGLPEALADVQETPLSHSLCQYVVRTKAPLIVGNTREHPALQDNPAVRDLGVVAYAGVPLTTTDGQILGSFCAIDSQQRNWTDAEVSILRTLADSVQAEIELRIAERRARRQAQEAGRQAQEAQRARREREALLESTAEGIYGIDPEGRCTFVNPAAAQMLGYTCEEMLGRNMHALVHDHQSDGALPPEMDCPITQVSQSGQGRRLEEDVFRRRDGTSFPVDYSSSPLIEAGSILGTVVAFADITSRKEAEAVLRASLERERHIAETLQRAILQNVTEASFPGLTVAARYVPAQQEARIGGDFFDAVPLADGRTAFVVGDASGKGLGAAVRMAEVKNVLRGFLREDAAPETALARLNNYLCQAQRLEARSDDSFVALTLAVIDAATGIIRIATAGAEPPLILRADGRAEIVKARGIPVGMLPEQHYSPMELQQEPGDLILLATDGITEARRDREFLGYEGMVALAHSASIASDSLSEIAQQILDGARAFAGGSLHDDACLFLIRRD